jgi:dihydroorotate dehydrogenase
MLYPAILRPLLFRLDPERAHELAIRGLEHAQNSKTLCKILERLYDYSDKRLEQELFGLQFKNPIGLAAGFDKNGRLIHILPCLGFGFLEIGTITSQAQPGNPKPRLFRLPQQQALINRLGFNNEGAERVAERLARLGKPPVPLGINIGKSRDVPLEEAPDDYLKTFRLLYPFGDYFSINVSSPNTPGLRELQSGERLTELLRALNDENQRLTPQSGRPKPLLLKIAPDLDEAQLNEILDVACAEHLAGIIATNTTVAREGLCENEASRYGEGGLSGRPLGARTTAIIRAIHHAKGGAPPIIGVGGIMNAIDSWEKLRAGASLLQIYTGLIYEGPSFVRRINRALGDLIERSGFQHISEVAGQSQR